jgi:hypothetical protein
VRVLVMVPQNFQRVFVLDNSNRVFASTDEGASWTELTANLGSFTNSVRAIEIFNPDASFHGAVLYAGGLGGAWKMTRPTAGGEMWEAESSNLPSAVLVYDLRYDYMANILSAASLGRGVYELAAHHEHR